MGDRNRIIDDPENFDVEKFEEYEKVVSHIAEGMMSIFKKEMAHGHTMHAMLAACYSPATFLFNIFDVAEQNGVDVSKDFPDLMRVYLNYLRALSHLAPLWGIIPYKEFRDKFDKAYNDLGHFAYEIDN